MKKLRNAVFGTFSFIFVAITQAQTPPSLTISNDSSTSVLIGWTNEPGTTYRLWFTPALAESSWEPLEDAFSAGETVSVGMSTLESTAGFFRVEIPTNSGVEILSLTNGQTVSGNIPVRVGAQIGSSLMGINLYLDNALIGYVDSGGAAFDLDTTHFANGSHSLYVSAVDMGNNEMASDPIMLDFENSLRWRDPIRLFQFSVPIDADSDVYPADWTVFVEDETGSTVRVLSGTTLDGAIQTEWDDENGIVAPGDSAYTITLMVTSSDSQSSAMMMPSSFTTSLTTASVTTNDYGALEYWIEEPLPDSAALYSTMLGNYWAMPERDRIIFPPFWLQPTNTSELIQKKLSAREMYMTSHPRTAAQSGNVSFTTAGGGMTQAADAGETAQTSSPVWREWPWSSGEIILARQTISSLYFSGPVAQLLANIQTSVATAQNDLPGNRNTYQGQVLLMAHNGDYAQIRTALASQNPNTRAFYHFGHGSKDGNSIGYSEGTPNDGLTAESVSSLLHNLTLPARNGKPAKLQFKKPFNFVFLDGCMTGKGNFPNAFGIPREIPNSDYEKYSPNLKKRAFLGWTAHVTASILDSDHLNWTKAFWEKWLLEDPNSITVKQARDAADAMYPSAASTGTVIIGSENLKWSGN